MKRTFCLLIAALFAVTSLAFAEEAMLIDFTELEADWESGEEDSIVRPQNSRTMMDYSVAAGATFSQEQKDLMKTSLALTEWEVVLNSSARNVISQSESHVVAAPVKDTSSQPFAGKNVMGVRITFPEWASNANAKIVPPFDIPAYQLYAEIGDDGKRADPDDETKAQDRRLFEEGFGLVKNVGVLKAISVTTMGMNYPHALYVLLKDNDGVERRYFMGNLGFDGWKTLRWDNPQYVTEVRHRELRVYPIYPRGIPYMKFAGFYIARDGAHIGGDFIGYFKDVKIIYDKALLTTERDIADEDLWGIVRTREAKKQADEMQRFGAKQVNRYLEQAKLATEDDFTPSLNEGEGTAGETQ